MPLLRAPANLLREDTDDPNIVTRVELFFDLVFIFANIQLTYALLGNLTVRGMVEAGLLLIAVWWVWVYTTWMTNLLDPERWPVRVLLLALTGGGLVLATTILDAFTTRGLAFALVYVAVQLGRTLFVAWALHRWNNPSFDVYRRILIRLLVSGTFWIAGGWSDGDQRLVLWLIAAAIDVLSPATGFWVPGLGRSAPESWNIGGSHMAERTGLFVLIALGESVLATGRTFVDLPQTSPVIVAFTIAFLSTVAMWWVYFHTGSHHASKSLEDSSEPGRLTRSAYTYLHLPIIAGIIVVAVAAELVLAHPEGSPDNDTTLMALAGPALFLGGTLGFKWAAMGRFAAGHLVGLLILAALIPASQILSALVLYLLSTGAIVVTAIWEGIATERAGEEELTV